jgi:hypothetical protein
MNHKNGEGLGARFAARLGSGIVIAAAVLAFGGRAYAQGPPAATAGPLAPEQWSVTPWATLAFGGDLEDGGAGLGAALGYNWNSRLAIEADFSLLPSVEQGVLLNVDSTVWNLTGNLVYHFAEQNWVPYVAGGLGIGRGSTDLDAADPILAELDLDESSTEMVFDFGGGVKRRLNDRTQFRGDLRYFTGDDLVSDFMRLYVGLTFDVGGR